MKTVNVHEAKTHLSRLIQEAVEGESFIIARAGKPLVKVVALEGTKPQKKQRLGFMKGEFEVPENFDTLYEDEILKLFGIKE
ncbi:MAG TPA: type II toxin-antitoxin system prevent-host-death family antitoxin [Terriglobales bacterium]|jgi:prevent-host-death family protein